MSKKTTTKTKVEVSTPTVTLMSYTMRAVIPTGPYANVQPEITVQAGSLDEAKDYILPHIDALYEKYLNLSDRPKPRVLVKEVLPVAQVVVPAPEVPKNLVKEAVALVQDELKKIEDSKPAPVVVIPSTYTEELIKPVKAMNIEELANSKPGIISQTSTYTKPQAVLNAQTAIESCKSIEALVLISQKIDSSIKLDALDKADLTILVKAKRDELQG